MLKRNRILALTVFIASLALSPLVAESNDKHDASSTTVEAKKTEGESKEDLLKLSEAFGHFIGRNLNTPGIKFDLDSVIKGMREGAAGKPAPMNDTEYEAMMAKMQEKAYTIVSEENLKAANEYLAKNAKEKQVKELEPGKLQYIILEEGKGPAVEEHASPLIQYTGKYIDGTVFGSSKEAGGPITIPLDQTIPGFSKGILGMKEGEKRRLFVHPDLGYGTMGHLPPNSLLIFEVEILKANQPEKGELSDDEEDLDGLGPLALEDDEDGDMDEEDEDDMEEEYEQESPNQGKKASTPSNPSYNSNPVK